MEEIWRDTPGCEGYVISNNNGWKNKNWKWKNRKQPWGIVVNNYRQVSIGNGKRRLYHRLVAKAFPEICGEWFEGCHVHHLNHNTLDNRPENLEIISPSKHSKMHYKTLPETFKKPSLERNKSISQALKGKPAYKKWKGVLQYTKEGVFIKDWNSLSEIEKELGYSAGNICSCCKKRIKTAYDYIWRYKEREVA